jgi:hypothetical protein
MAVTIVRRRPDGQIERVKLDDSRVKAIPKRPLPHLQNPDEVFAGNTRFVGLDPNKYFKRKR